MKRTVLLFLVLTPILLLSCLEQEGWTPDLLELEESGEAFLPDYSYAGYHFGEKEIPGSFSGTSIDITEFGAVPDDDSDDSDAVIEALMAAAEIDGPVKIRFPAGRIIISKPIYIERSQILLSGAGSGQNGTTLYFPKPMNELPVPETLRELQKYLVDFNKTQKVNDLGEKIDPLPFSLYSWSGGYLWFRVPGVRVKKYLLEYDQSPEILATLTSGRQGEKTMQADLPVNLAAGDVAEIQWYNRDGENSSLLQHIYGDTSLVSIGSHHWSMPERALVTQQVLITGVEGKNIEIKTPLMLDIRPEWTPVIAVWEHLEEVGIQGFRMESPLTPGHPHHVEDGYNAVYFTRIFNGWAQDLVFHNLDNGILTEEDCNMTIRDIRTTGEKLAHYSVVVSGSHNILVEDLEVYNPVRHALSFNTLATRSVYKNCRIYEDPMLDQHSGLNHQNLFDNIFLVDSTIVPGQNETILLTEGGAKYWKPACGTGSTFWNIEASFVNAGNMSGPVIPRTIFESPSVNIIGMYGNLPIQLDFGPNAHVEGLNQPGISIESLYDYQLNKRISQ